MTTLCRRGLPADQIGETKPYAHIRGTNKRIPDESDVMYRYGVIFRQYHGVRIEESIAWARLNVDGDSITESVYWPEIPASVLSDADALNATLADTSAKASFFARLPSGAVVDRGSVVIHHTPGIYMKSFASAAVFDVSVNGNLVHVGLDGKVVVLPTRDC